MLASENTLNILKTKLDWLKKQKPEDFIFVFKDIIEYLLTTSEIKYQLDSLQSSYESKRKEYICNCKAEEKKAIVLERRFLKEYPQYDDSNIKRPTTSGTEDISYMFSFAYFNDLAKGDDYQKNRIALEPDIADDTSKVKKMLDILNKKLFPIDLQTGLNSCVDESIGVALHNLYDTHTHTQDDWYIYNMSSPAVTWLQLLGVYSKISPTPKLYKSFAEKRNDQTSNQAIHEDLFGLKVDDFIFARSKYSNRKSKHFSNEKLQESMEAIIYAMEKLCNKISISLSMNIAQEALMLKYKHKCEIYEREELYKMKKAKLTELENRLTKYNAKFLFDNNINPAFRVKKGTTEYDLIQDEDVPNPIFIESKVYGKREEAIVPSTVYQWYNQVVYYIAEKNVKTNTIFLLTYHLGNRPLILPHSIKIGEYIVISVNISIVPSKQAGKNALAPLIILEEDIIKAFSEQKKTRKKS